MSEESERELQELKQQVALVQRENARTRTGWLNWMRATGLLPSVYAGSILLGVLGMHGRVETSGRDQLRHHRAFHGGLRLLVPAVELPLDGRKADEGCLTLPRSNSPSATFQPDHSVGSKMRDAVSDHAADSRLPKSAGSKIFPFSSTISTCHPSLAHTFALATTMRELTRLIQTVSSSRSAII